jgi:hypothetical protein
MNKTAKFWKYTGNHSSGNDCERSDPHGFGLALIGYMAWIGEGGDYQPPISYADTQAIKVKHHKGDDFGHEVTVKAPQEVWERGAESLKASQAIWS